MYSTPRINQNNEKLLSDIQQTSSPHCIFLDVDGTLSELSIDPERSFISEEALFIVQKFKDLDIPIFAVTGRSASTAYQLFDPVELPIASTHGLEISSDSKHTIQAYSPHPEFKNLKHDLENSSSAYPELLIEHKSHSIALHYRSHPNLREISKTIMLNLLQKFHFMKLSEGKFVWELVPIEADKGIAIQKLIKHYQLDHYRPLFIGDDITDESGFISVNRRNGISIKVGEGETHAKYCLANVNAVIQFLADLFITFKNTNNNINQHKEKHNV